MSHCKAEQSSFLCPATAFATLLHGCSILFFLAVDCGQIINHFCLVVFLQSLLVCPDVLTSLGVKFAGFIHAFIAIASNAVLEATCNVQYAGALSVCYVPWCSSDC